MSEQINALRDAGILDSSESEALLAGASFLRAVDHAERLVLGRPARSIPQRPGQAEGVEQLLRLWGFIDHDGSEVSFPARLGEVQDRVRTLFHRVLAR